MFALSDPERIDLLALLGLECSARLRVHSWTAGPSDVAGCICLQGPERIEPTCSPSDPSAPPLLTMLRLRALGWRGAARAQVHSEGAPKVFDSRDASRKAAYFQLLLRLPEVWRKGYTELPSGQPQSFYRAVLVKHELVAPGAGDNAYKKLLADAGCDVGRDAQPKRMAFGRFAAASRRRLLNDVTAAEPDDFADIAGDSPDGVGAEPLPESGDDPVGQGARADEPASASSSAAWPAFISGVRVRIVAANPSDGYGYHERLAVRCSNPAHRCTKSRSVQLHVDRWGRRAAELFLGAWLSRSDLPEAAHRSFTPSDADIAAYRDAHPDT